MEIHKAQKKICRVAIHSPIDFNFNLFFLCRSSKAPCQCWQLSQQEPPPGRLFVYAGTWLSIAAYGLEAKTATGMMAGKISLGELCRLI